MTIRPTGLYIISTADSPPARHPAGTFGALPCYGGMTKPDIWYVAFSPDRDSDEKNGAVRSTRTFKSEVDAKLFALQILAKGWTASAGTLNPYQPKQVIAASQIDSWADSRDG